MNPLTSLQKIWQPLSILLLLALVAALFFLPIAAFWLGISLFFISLGMTILFVIQKHSLSYRQGDVTRAKSIRNVLLDLLGVIIVIGVASSLGGMAGIWASNNYGIWMGIVAGMAAGFLSAWGVGLVWKKSFMLMG